jgi:hypothetical protein
MTDDLKPENTEPELGVASAPAAPTTGPTATPATGATSMPSTGATAATATGPTATGPTGTRATATPATGATATGSSTGTAPIFPAQPPFPGTTPTTAPAPLLDAARRPHPAQFGTIVWGMLLLALCGFVGLTQFGPGVDADRYLWAFIGVIAVGVALVAVGIVAAFRR